ncbi:hypothetical protein MK489_02385 [Myxococcota bacterium]|nr:hypothetical protein [Myxococcota bacterium]
MSHGPEFRAAVEDALLRDEPDELMNLVMDVALEASDPEWAQACCVQLSKHRNAQVRGNAVLGLGHLARRFGQLDLQRVGRVMNRALFDRSPFVREQAESAADDLETFLSWRFERPES